MLRRRMLQASRNVALVQRAYDAFTRRDVERPGRHLLAGHRVPSADRAARAHRAAVPRARRRADLHARRRARLVGAAAGAAGVPRGRRRRRRRGARVRVGRGPRRRHAGRLGVEDARRASRCALDVYEGRPRRSRRPASPADRTRGRSRGPPPRRGRWSREPAEPDRAARPGSWQRDFLQGGPGGARLEGMRVLRRTAADCVHGDRPTQPARP